MQLAGNQN